MFKLSQLSIYEDSNSTTFFIRNDALYNGRLLSNLVGICYWRTKPEIVWQPYIINNQASIIIAGFKWLKLRHKVK